jgi:hypothetical protein
VSGLESERAVIEYRTGADPTTTRHDLGIYRDLVYVPPERHHEDFAY